MFEEIINSKKLTQAAAAFLSLPPRSYSIAEASSLFRVSSSTGSHILNRLLAHNLLRTFTKHGKKYYFFNSKHEVPAWARSKILRNRKKWEDRLFEDAKNLSVKAAYLSGVFTGYVNLPVDILLVGRADLKRLDRFLDKWEGIMGTELNYSVMSEREFLSRKGTFDKFIKDIFDHRHVVVFDRVVKK
jgi:hypothetical protein